jgi:hypothetical protein
MKIRIKDNSIRYRLTKTEVKQLCTQYFITSQTVLASNTLTYNIQVQDNIENLSADFVANTITLFFPKVDADAWYENEIITHQHTIKTINGSLLKLVLEKDFVCLDHSDEDQSDNYANPNKTC